MAESTSSNFPTQSLHTNGGWCSIMRTMVGGATLPICHTRDANLFLPGSKSSTWNDLSPIGLIPRRTRSRRMIHSQSDMDMGTRVEVRAAPTCPTMAGSFQRRDVAATLVEIEIDPGAEDEVVVRAHDDGIDVLHFMVDGMLGGGFDLLEI